jgi:phosphocarrier protein
MKSCLYTITDPLGVHARPAGLLIKKMQEFSSVFFISRGEARIDGKKLIALMKLKIKQGETLKIEAEGDDEEAAIAAVQAFLSQNL